MKSRYNTFIALLLAASSLFGCVEPEQEIPVSVRLNKEMMTSLSVGASQTLVATVMPKGTEVSLMWASDQEDVAIVDDQGKVTGVAPGTALISVTADEAVATCEVTVVAIKAEKISLEPKEIELEVDQEYELEVIFTPAEASASDLEWSVDKPSVATVDNKGKVTAKSAGTCVVIAKCNKGKLAAACHVTVVDKEEGGEDIIVEAESMELDPSSLDLVVGNERAIRAVFYPDNATVTDLEWATSNDAVVTVNDGKVKAIKEGNAVITATCNGGKLSAKCEVTVSEASGEISITGVILFAQDNAGDVQVGKTLQLNAVYEPAGAVPNNVSWTVDRPTSADVDQNGLVTGKSANKVDNEWEKVVVTLTADDKSASLTLRVIPEQPEYIEVDLPENNQLRVGEEWDFNPRVIPEGLGYGVTCSIMKPGNKFTSEAKLSSDEPGTIAAQFAVATNENLVYESYRRNVNVSVIPYWVESVTLPDAQEMEVGGSLILSPVFTSDVEGVQPTYKDVRWSSSDQSVASINEKTGEIKAHTAGQTTITVTTANEWSVPGGQAQKSATCVLTVKAADSGLNVGDYFYSDGTWSSELQSGKTVVGVVFAKANATAADPVLAKDFPNCTHGLVLGLTEYVDQDFGSVSCYSGHGYYTNLGYDASSIVDVEKQNGYGNSKAHRDLNASKADYVALFNAESGVIATQTNAVATPSGASSWYVPSYKEMTMILANYDTVNAAIVSAGGMAIATPNPIEDSWDDNRTSDWYWTSTIWGNWSSSGYEHFKYAFDLSKGGWTTSQQSFAKCKVRVVFAF